MHLYIHVINSPLKVEVVRQFMWGAHDTSHFNPALWDTIGPHRKKITKSMVLNSPCVCIARVDDIMPDVTFDLFEEKPRGMEKVDIKVRRLIHDGFPHITTALVDSLFLLLQDHRESLMTNPYDVCFFLREYRGRRVFSLRR